MPNIKPTKHALALAKALKKRGVEYSLEYWDGHKHVDIYILKNKIYIEIDGVQHQTRPSQIIADFNRDYFSAKGGFFTKHITNEAIETHLEEITDAITDVANNRDNMIRNKL